MEQLTRVFDVIFHWAGVWAVMVYGTVGAHHAFLCLRGFLHTQAKKRMFREVIRRIPVPPKPDAPGKNPKPDATPEADAVTETA